MKEVTIIADDKVGLLADISYIVGKSKVNIESINVDVVSKKAIITLTLSDSEKGTEVLAASGYQLVETNGVVVKLNDQPGELSKITKLLSEEGVNITNVHMLSKDGKNTVLSVVVDNPRKATSILQDYLITKESKY